MKKKFVPKLLIFLIVWLMLSISFSAGLTEYTANGFVSDIDPYSDGIMIADLIYHDNYSGNNYLLDALNTDVDPFFTHENIVNYYLSGTAPEADVFVPYTSNITIHRFVYRVLDFLIPNPQLALQCMDSMNACLLALTLTIGIYLVYCWCKSWLWVAVSSVLAAFFMPVIDSYSENLYWSIFVIFLPFVIALWDAVQNQDSLMAGKKKIWQLFLVTFVPCLLKNLFYFEFVTTMMVSVMLPYVYLWFALWQKETFSKALHNIKILIVPAVGAIGAFVAAVGVRILLTSLDLGSLSEGITNFFGNISYRLLDGSDTYVSSLQLIQQAGQLTAISFKNGIDITFFQLWVAGLVGLIVINVLYFRKKAPFSLQLLPLDVVFLCSSFGSISWFIFANPHANIHLWLTPLLFFIPTVFLLLFLIVMTVKCVVREFLQLSHADHGDNRSQNVLPLLSRLGVSVVLGLLCMEIADWSDCMIVADGVKSKSTLLGTIGSSQLYLGNDHTSLYYVDTRASKSNVIDIRLYAELVVPSFTRQPMYNAQENCLEYKVSSTEIQTAHAYFPLLGTQTVGKITIPEYLYDRIDWAVQDSGNSSMPDFSTSNVSQEELSDLERIQPAEMTDDSWTNGIFNTESSVVLVPADLQMYKAFGQSYTTKSGKTVTVIDIIPEGNWMHLQFDQSIEFSDGYPNEFLAS